MFLRDGCCFQTTCRRTRRTIHWTAPAFGSTCSVSTHAIPTTACVSGRSLSDCVLHAGLCGTIPTSDLPDGCRNFVHDVSALRFKPENPADCQQLGGNEIRSSFSTPTPTHPGVDLEIIFAHNETDSTECEREFIVSLTQGKDLNPGTVMDKCSKAWWSKSKPDDSCEKECGFVATWPALTAPVKPPTPPPPPADDSVVIIIIVLVVLVLVCLAILSPWYHC